MSTTSKTAVNSVKNEAAVDKVASTDSDEIESKSASTAGKTKQKATSSAVSKNKSAAQSKTKSASTTKKATSESTKVAKADATKETAKPKQATSEVTKNTARVTSKPNSKTEDSAESITGAAKKTSKVTSNKAKAEERGANKAEEDSTLVGSKQKSEDQSKDVKVSSADDKSDKASDEQITPDELPTSEAKSEDVTTTTTESKITSDDTESDKVEDSELFIEKRPTSTRPNRIFIPKRGTHSTKVAEAEKKWVLVDAEGVVVGRLASFIANRLRGKHKPSFTPHIDDGDNVIVINADKVVFTGRKFHDKKYFWHTGFPGGIKERTPRAIMEGKFPERIIEKAVKRMMPGGPLSNKQFKNMRVYSGPDHPHTAQQPEIIDFGSFNQKNKKRA